MATFTKVEIPKTASDLNRPGAGLGLWHRNDNADYPAVGNRQPRFTGYHRFGWRQLEKTNSSGQAYYDFARLEEELVWHMSQTPRKKFGFGVMAVCPGGCDPWNGSENVDGYPMLYPTYLHNLMQGEADKDRIIGGTWVPNWNSANFLGRLRALHQALYNYVDTKIIGGRRVKDAISYIEVRIMGSYGEWHHGGLVNYMTEYPTYMRPTVASYKTLIDSVVDSFPDIQPVILFAAYDGNRLNHTMTPPEVGYYALTKKNAAGMLIGIRRDQMGSGQYSNSGNYVRQYMQDNYTQYNGVTFRDLILARPDFAPLCGEPENADNMPTMEQQVNDHRINECGNGNYPDSATADENIRKAGKHMGYRLVLVSGSFNPSGSTLVTSFNWKNANPTPPYDNWTAVLRLKKAGVVKWSGNSQFKIKGFKGSSTVSDSFGIPATVPLDDYDLTVEIVDPSTYWPNMPLFIEGAQAGNVYSLGTIRIGGGGATPPNQKPLVFAGNDQTITLPISTAVLVATASDPDGTIDAASRKWERLSGPGSPSIANPNALSTQVQGLVEGIHEFRFSCKDDDGDLSSDTVLITVKPAIPPTVKTVTRVTTVLDFSDGSKQESVVYTG